MPQRSYIVNYDIRATTEGAVKAFTEAGKYSDAETQIMETRYQQAKTYMEKANYFGAISIFTGIKGYKDVDSLLANDHNLAAIIARDMEYREGGWVKFGHYPQTSEGNDNTPIEWHVLARNGNKALLISRYGIDILPYNEMGMDITWEECTLRTWLNGIFLSKAFTAVEQMGIVLTNVDNSSSQGCSEWRTHGGNNTQDKIFLLSYAEANKYLGVTLNGSSNPQSDVSPTKYAFEQWSKKTPNSNKRAYEKAGRWAWWLRSPGRDQAYVACVVSGRSGFLSYAYDNEIDLCVRPALWIDLESDIF